MIVNDLLRFRLYNFVCILTLSSETVGVDGVVAAMKLAYGKFSAEVAVLHRTQLVSI